MAQTDLTKLSASELQSKLNSLKKASLIFIIMLVLMAIAGIALTMMRGFSIFTVMPVIFLPMAVANASNIKKINAELATRDA